MTYQDHNQFCSAPPATSHVVQWGGSHLWKIDPRRSALSIEPAPRARDVHSITTTVGRRRAPAKKAAAPEGKPRPLI
jgi:hypothetical protein